MAMTREQFPIVNTGALFYPALSEEDSRAYDAESGIEASASRLLH